MKMNYAIHSDFLIHWTGKDIDNKFDSQWNQIDRSTTKNSKVVEEYLKRLLNILKFGLWMTSEADHTILLDKTLIEIPPVPKICFTELKLSESRKHAKQFGRLGIGVKRPFLFERFGRPVIYYGYYKEKTSDIFLNHCNQELTEKNLLNFFKPMNSSKSLNYDLFNESEWRIIYHKYLITKKLIIDPRDSINIKEHAYFQTLTINEQNKLKYLMPLDGWLTMIIYPSLNVKNRAQQDTTYNIKTEINRIKTLNDQANRVEEGNWPIELNIDACRNF